MEINLKNIENVVFYNEDLQKLFPQYRYLFDQWRLAQMNLGFKQLGQKSVLEFLNSIDANAIQILQEYFKENIIVNKMDHNLTANLDCNLDDEFDMCQFVNYRDFCITRKDKNLSITFWR